MYHAIQRFSVGSPKIAEGHSHGTEWPSNIKVAIAGTNAHWRATNVSSESRTLVISVKNRTALCQITQTLLLRKPTVVCPGLLHMCRFSIIRVIMMFLLLTVWLSS